jgi:hypothetical protein
MEPLYRRLLIRTWGRLSNPTPGGPPVWVPVVTQSNGDNSAVWFTTLIQCLLLNLNEDPRFANWGIPAQQSVLTQIFPDFYTYQTQSQFKQYFLNLTVQKVNSPTPTYNINAITFSGATLSAVIPV